MSREQRTMIDAMLRQPRPEGPQPVEAMRAGFRAMMAAMIVPDGIRTTATTLAARPALLVEPVEGARAGTILYFHGGGFVFGSPETALSLTGNLVTKTGARAYSLDYRLAPEHPFPAAIEDTLSAYRALLDGGEDPSGIVFAGDSAGGGLAVTTCLAARAANLPCLRRSSRSRPASTPPGRARAWTPKQASTRSSPANRWGTPEPCTSRGRTRNTPCSARPSGPT